MATPEQIKGIIATELENIHGASVEEIKTKYLHAGIYVDSLIQKGIFPLATAIILEKVGGATIKRARELGVVVEQEVIG